MSRHKNFARGYDDYVDDYDDELSSSYGNSFNSVNSPTTASYLIDRGRGTPLVALVSRVSLGEKKQKKTKKKTKKSFLADSNALKQSTR